MNIKIENKGLKALQGLLKGEKKMIYKIKVKKFIDDTFAIIRIEKTALKLKRASEAFEGANRCFIS